MYYLSESSDSENDISSNLDFSYLLMDSESIALHLKISVQEAEENKQSKQAIVKKDMKSDCNSSGAASDQPSEPSNLSVRKRNQNKTIGTGRHGTVSEASTTERISHAIGKDSVTEKLLLHHNVLLTLPFEITLFPNLKFLDLSNNNLTHINDFLLSLVNLQTLYLKNNGLSDGGLPKDLHVLTKLRELNLSGNRFTRIPPQIYNIVSLKFLYLGSNEIVEVLPDIKNLQGLQVLHLGGNQLEKVPDELGQLHQLGVLALCDNKIRRLPRVISQLTRLRSLLLHKNNMCCLPVGIVKLRGLTELSLRDNPLVNKFVTCCAKEIMYTPPSLLELAARVIKLKNVQYSEEDIPRNLYTYVNSGQKCVNPKCKGMYFTSCVEHIKFVDFCGKYRVPLMHYLCSSKCSSTTPTYYQTRSDSESEEDSPHNQIRRVLLG